MRLSEILLSICRPFVKLANHRKRVRYREANIPDVVAVLAIMKNESYNVKEWIEHYLWQGAQQIYLIDNGSDDNTLEVIQPWINSGQVKVLVRNEKWQQEKHYWTAIRHFKIQQSCRWLVVADLDEFWFCKDGRTLSDALSSYLRYDVIYANWTMFGSGGWNKHPDSLRLRLTEKDPKLGPNDFTKFICRARVLSTSLSLAVHKVFGACSSKSISDNEAFQINHYSIQSREYYENVKMARGDAHDARNESIRDWTSFEKYNRPCVVEDRQLADMLIARNAQSGTRKP